MLKHVVLVPSVLFVATSMAQAVGGSYQESCENIQQRGPYLSAECRTVDGDYRRTSIDVRGCYGGVSNTNGRLTCGRGRGYDEGYDRGSRGYGEQYGEPPRRYFRAPSPYQDDDD